MTEPKPWNESETDRVARELHERGLRKPRVLILGWARHGKDTVAEIMRDEHGYTFESSSFFLAEKVVRPELERRGIAYESLDECYEDRVNHRATWRGIIGDFNGDDPSPLARSILEVSDCYVGMRTDREYRASRDLFDAVVWVDASRRDIPPEGRDSMDIDYDPTTMFRIENGGTIEWLRVGVRRFVEEIESRPQMRLPLV